VHSCVFHACRIYFHCFRHVKVITTNSRIPFHVLLLTFEHTAEPYMLAFIRWQCFATRMTDWYVNRDAGCMQQRLWAYVVFRAFGLTQRMHPRHLHLPAGLYPFKWQVNANSWKQQEMKRTFFLSRRLKKPSLLNRRLNVESMPKMITLPMHIKQ